MKLILYRFSTNFNISILIYYILQMIAYDNTCKLDSEETSNILKHRTFGNVHLVTYSYRNCASKLMPSRNKARNSIEIGAQELSMNNKFPKYIQEFNVLESGRLYFAKDFVDGEIKESSNVWNYGILVLWSLNENHFEKLNEPSTMENGYIPVGQIEFLNQKIRPSTVDKQYADSFIYELIHQAQSNQNFHLQDQTLYKRKKTVQNFRFSSFEQLNNLITGQTQAKSDALSSASIFSEVVQKCYRSQSEREKNSDMTLNNIETVQSLTDESAKDIKCRKIDKILSHLIDGQIDSKALPNLYIRWEFHQLDEKCSVQMNEVCFCERDENKNIFKIDDKRKDFQNLEYLSLSSNKTLTFDTNSFVDFKRLEFLSLANNLITQLDEHSFSGLQQLERLILSNNKLTRINTGVFRKFPRLTHLDLSFNQIDHLEMNGCSSLQYLYLQNNSIKAIHLNGLNRLEHLDLSNNQLSKIEFLSSANLKSLRYLSLYQNQISNIDNLKLEILPSLVELNLSFNKIKTLNLLTFGIKNKLKKLLNLKGNPIRINNNLHGIGHCSILKGTNMEKEIKREEKSTTNDLNQVYETGNHRVFPNCLLQNSIYILTEVKNDEFKVPELVFESGSFGDGSGVIRRRSLSRHDPHCLTKDILARLLSKSEAKTDIVLAFSDIHPFVLYTSIHPHAFQNYTFLTNLSLSNLHLQESLHPQTFSECKDLVELKLCNNRISSIPSNLLKCLPHLQYISLGENLIKEIPSEFLCFSPKLVCVSFHTNKLREINDNVFKESHNLKILLLSYNKISSVPHDAFINLANVTYLDLSHNRIALLDENILVNLHKLQDLNLKNNQIDKLAPNLFCKNVRLNTLNLSTNRLKFITSDLFSNLRSLSNLSIANNRLKIFSICPLTQLQELDLSKNNIKKFDRNHFDGYSNLNVIKLGGNPISRMGQLSIRQVYFTSNQNISIDLNCSRPIF